MLYNPRPDPPQVRHRCRNPRCGGNLKTPSDNPRDAFCCRGCERQFYGCRCRVCESLFDRKTSRRQVCQRTKCRYQFQHHSERYFGSRSITPQNVPIAHNARANPIKIGAKSDGKSGRAYLIIAGPAADPINFGNWPGLPKPRPVLIGRTAPPVNVIGGYRFPDAPKVDLSSIHADRVPA